MYKNNEEENFYKLMDKGLTMKNIEIKNKEMELKEKYLNKKNSKLTDEQKLEHPYNVFLKIYRKIYEEIDNKVFFTYKVMSFLSNNYNNLFTKYLLGKLSEKIYNIEDMDFLCSKVFSEDHLKKVIEEKRVCPNMFQITFLQMMIKSCSIQQKKTIYETLVGKEYIDLRTLPVGYALDSRVIKKAYDMLHSTNEQEDKCNKEWFKYGIMMDLHTLRSFEEFKQRVHENYLISKLDSLDSDKKNVSNKRKI